MLPKEEQRILKMEKKNLEFWELVKRQSAREFILFTNDQDATRTFKQDEGIVGK